MLEDSCLTLNWNVDGSFLEREHYSSNKAGTYKTSYQMQLAEFAKMTKTNLILSFGSCKSSYADNSRHSSFRGEWLLNIQDVQQTDTTYVGIKRIDYL